jgi:hypothetical protein
MIVCNESFNYTAMSDDLGNYDFSEYLHFITNAMKQKPLDATITFHFTKKAFTKKFLTIIAQGFREAQTQLLKK